MQKLSTAMLALFIATGCASVFKGTSQTLTFSSDPSGAEVLIDGRSQGKTPLSIRLKKNKYETVLIRKKGYNSISRPLDKSYDAVALVNIFWDLSTTDLITGAVYEYEPTSYHFALEKSDADDDSGSQDKTEKKPKAQ